MGSVLTEWQSLEFNPYNYLRGSDGWDPLGLAPMYAEIHQLLDAAVVDTNTGEELPPCPRLRKGTPSPGYQIVNMP